MEIPKMQASQSLDSLRLANHTLNSIIAASPQAIIAVDKQRNVRLWNPAAEQIFGWSSSEVIGNRVPFIAQEHKAESDVFSERALSGEAFSNYQVQRQRRDGSMLDLLVSCAPTYDDKGLVDGFVTVVSDITEHKQLEQRFLRAQRLESLGTLASGIAHDLNNVLAPIAMALELFRGKFKDNELQHTLDTLDSCVQRGSDLIRQVLTFARGVQGERVPVHTRHLLMDTEKVLVHTFPKSVTITSDIPTDLWLINADSTQLHQVMMNLCINARDAMAHGGKLTITARNVVIDETYAQLNRGLSPGSYVVIDLQDTGHGIPPEIRTKIFEPFFTTKDSGKGTGLGLSTVAAIVKNHGGFINVYSEPGRGTSFKIYFPALPGSVDQSASKLPEALPVGAGELILIVDDEGAVRDIAKLTLETHGYKVIEAENGAQGIAVYGQHENDIQLVISDMDMPVMDGATMVRLLERINPEIRVISASGLVGGTPPPAAPTPRRALLPKPYTARELLNTVQRILNAA